MANTYECVVMKEAYGGKGEVRLEMLLGETELKDKCGLFARLEEMGNRDGDTVDIYDLEFEYMR